MSASRQAAGEQRHRGEPLHTRNYDTTQITELTGYVCLCWRGVACGAVWLLGVCVVDVVVFWWSVVCVCLCVCVCADVCSGCVHVILDGISQYDSSEKER